jgi:hypothetical protein
MLEAVTRIGEHAEPSAPKMRGDRVVERWTEQGDGWHVLHPDLLEPLQRRHPSRRVAITAREVEERINLTITVSAEIETPIALARVPEWPRIRVDRAIPDAQQCEVEVAGE